MVISILGSRGIPAKHGGFETFSEHLSLYLTQKGWKVNVYCQQEGDGPIYEDDWNGVHCVHIPVSKEGAIGTIIFDWKSTLHAASRKYPILTLGYNTALFCAIYRLKGIKNVINMDGIEWRRGKWSSLERIWLYINEKLGTLLGNHLIADHPEIKNHLAKFTHVDKITVIPYSADVIENANPELLGKLDLKPNKYVLLIARAEPENSIFEIVKAYSRKKREIPLIVLGDYSPAFNKYHKKVISAASDEVRFVGAIYQPLIVRALRFYARIYVHGHTVGGTNPSLVEALGASSPVLAHNNKFNRWVAGEKAHYFSSENECADKLDLLLENDEEIAMMKENSRRQLENNFAWNRVHKAYEEILKKQLI